MNIFAQFLPDFMQFSTLETANLILLLGLIMFLGALGGRIFQKLRIPQVVGYIVIGVFIGQSGFQLLSASVITALDPLSNVALSLIGFLIGAELKLSVIKKYGKQFIGILLFEAIVPFFVVALIVLAVAYVLTRDFTTSLAMALVLGSISSATAPAATTDVLKENRTRGPLTMTVLGIVAMDDAVALILYAIASSAASILLGGGAGLSLGDQLISLLYEVGGSIVVGSLTGLALGQVIRNLMSDEGRILSFSLGALFLCTGLCTLLAFDNILAAMSLGFAMVNFAPAKTRETFSLVEKFTPPIYVMFFVLVGAKLNIWNVNAFVAVLAILYVMCRTLGKSVGARIGARLTGAPETVRRYLPFCLLSQAGVAIGLSIAAGHDFATTIGPTIMLIITATTFVVQLVGPICVKHGVTKAGECGLDITEEDLMKNSTVQDITWGTASICRPDSPAIVSETSTLKAIISAFSHHENLSYAVCDPEGRLSGIITLEHLKEALLVTELSESLMACDVMEAPQVTCTATTPVPELYKLFSDYDVETIPIVDQRGCCLGVAEKYTLDHYLHAKVVELHQRVAQLG
ncbi:MAG: cation:proton antiporter [Spirochaetaceae bacterium]|nr:cation:proton antiporter [Spirochaetaceae bacterium]MBQ8561144.1 cation:proton antiporter [Spirochaetaceae bacterium]